MVLKRRICRALAMISRQMVFFFYICANSFIVMQAFGEAREDLSTKYTILKLEGEDRITKLLNYLHEHKDAKKTSFCRFYLRGLCIMKSQHCKFAHDFSELDLEAEEYKKISSMDWSVGEKEARKKLFLEKSDFHQRPLFFIKNLDYLYLYHYQFSDRYKKSGIAPLTVAEINKQEDMRTRIRQIMHREQWDKLIDYIETVHPDVDYSISMFSTWFGKLGFEKSQTCCKFGDFMRYLAYVRGYNEVNIVVPPLTTRSVYFVRPNGTYMSERLVQIKEDSECHKAKVRKMKDERLKKLPGDLEKRFVCRFYMAGNCEKEREECTYAHSIEELRYDPHIEFTNQYRQLPKSKEDRINYITLYRYYQCHREAGDEQITLEDINAKFGLKDKIRRRVHLELYTGFLRKLEEVYQSRVLKLAVVKREYTRFGFNHTDENKFGQLEGYLWNLGFHQEELVDRNREKLQFIYRIPPLEEIDELYRRKIGTILQEELDFSRDSSQEGQQLLESSIRRLIYSHTDKEAFEIPLHVYLRRRNGSLKQVLEQHFPQYCQYIFFESSQENFKKLMELLKKYFKKQKRFCYRMEDIDFFIKSLSKDEINMNNFVNLKNLIELALLELGKEIYFWPLANANIVIDRAHTNKDNFHFHPKQTPLAAADEEKYGQLLNQWTVVVDDERTFHFCKAVLESCNVFGVDLEGKLSQNGYIDFVQISCRLAGRKHIFVIDIYLFQERLPHLLPALQHLIKSIFESEDHLKILHACQQDSIALYSCLGVRLRNVFDTSGVEIYLEQRRSYREMREFNHTFEHTLKKIHATKTPGLNQILERWQAPKGINQLKEAMKKVFSEAPRSYFTTRPIVEEFLVYSARDVEDLIEVWEEMSKAEPDGVWRIIGELYTPIY